MARGGAAAGSVYRPDIIESKQGEVSEQNQQELQERLDAFGEIRFLSVDLDAMQKVLEQLPWVDQARISRIWPDQLKIEVVEQQPIARWGNQQWLNSRGQVFKGVSRLPDSPMPQLLGPEGTEEQVMQQYWRLTQILRPMNYSIERLELRARGSWFVTTQSGLELLLGRDEMEKIAVYHYFMARAQSANGSGCTGRLTVCQRVSDCLASPRQ